ncbi:MAG: type II secretion system minor pseudopilin GspI [Nitrospinae bacterium]|nr:type II secretion system minor pseudopilin GspI [Nitrospinota bacterium]
MTAVFRDTQNSGFTIIEALVAVAIIAVAFGAVASASISALDAVEETRARFLALTCAKNRLVALQVMDAWPDAGISSDEEEQGGVKFHVETLSSRTANQDYVKVEISVALKDGDGRNLANLTGYLVKERRNENSEP